MGLHENKRKTAAARWCAVAASSIDCSVRPGASPWPNEQMVMSYPEPLEGVSAPTREEASIDDTSAEVRLHTRSTKLRQALSLFPSANMGSDVDCPRAKIQEFSSSSRCRDLAIVPPILQGMSSSRR